MLKKILAGWFCMIFLSSISLAADPAMMKEQANHHVMTASKLMERGFGLIQNHPTAANKQAAISLLIEAGQLFEKAAQIYQALTPEYASQADVDNSLRAMMSCIQTIGQIKETL